MRRRHFAGLVAGLIGQSFEAHSQPAAKLYVIGYLYSGDGVSDAFRQGLRDRGYVEGRTVSIEGRFAKLQLDRLPALAHELVQLPVDVIVTRSTPATMAARQATQTIPIVMATVGDAVGSGLVASLARPGGNVTGLSFRGSDVAMKGMQLIKEIAPHVARLAVLHNATIVVEEIGLTAMRDAGSSLGIVVEAIDVRTTEQLDAALRSLPERHVDALMAFESSLIGASRRQIVETALQNRLPTAFGSRLFATEGALIAYGIDFPALLYRAAYYVDRILKGANPADLPVEEPSKFTMTINLKTAKTLGLTIPPSILGRADEVIE